MPTIQIQPKVIQKILEGESVKYLCYVTAGIPKPKVVWSRQNNKMFSKNSKAYFDGLLLLSNLTMYDDGIYICTATNVIGTVSSTVDLRVLSVPTVTIIPHLHDLTLKSGDSLQLICNATGNPSPYVFWNKEHHGKVSL